MIDAGSPVVGTLLCVVVPFCVEKKHDEIKNNIEEKISELDDKYRVVMKIEEDYIGN